MLTLAAAAPPGRMPWLAAGAYLAAFGGLAAMVRCWPQAWSRKRSLMVTAALALGVRLAFWPTPPGNDMHRYVWEGAVQTRGVNPYLAAPASPELDPLATGPLAGIRVGVNHPELPAIYPPLPLIIFRGLAALTPDPRLFKAFFLLCDLALAALLARMLRLSGLPPRLLLFYAANPLVIVFVAGEAHLDVLQALLVVAGVHLLERRRPGWGFFCLGGAVVSKYLALALLPMALDRRRAPWAWAALAPLAAFLPFWEARRSWFAVLETFGRDFHTNDALTALLRILAGGAAPILAAVVLAVCLAAVWLTVPDLRRRIFLAACALLLCLPTLHPWYLVLAAPFMVFHPSRPWLYLMAGMAATFPVLGADFHTGVFREIPWLKWGMYFPFFVLLVQAARRDTRLWRGRSFPAPRRLSVVVPTLEEEDRLGDCLDSIEAQMGLAEVVVSDGGSGDHTVELAARRGCRVVAGPRGRGGQIRRGVAAATGDVVVVLHADTRLLPGTLARIMEALQRRPEAPGGACGMRFGEGEGRMRFVAWLNNRRAELFGIGFGDQAQFFRREALEAAGGYPDLPLMEDVELSLRLKSLGRPLFLPQGVAVSPRRWQRRGVLSNFLAAGALFLRYLAERQWDPEAAAATDYYRRYYRDTQ